MANDEIKKRKKKLVEGIDKLKMLLLLSKSDREKSALIKTIEGLEKKLDGLSKYQN